MSNTKDTKNTNDTDIKYFTYVSDSTNACRPCTEEENKIAANHKATLVELFAKQDEISKAIRELKNNCDHKYFYDKEGYIYHERCCVICGSSEYI